MKSLSSTLLVLEGFCNKSTKKYRNQLLKFPRQSIALAIKYKILSTARNSTEKVQNLLGGGKPEQNETSGKYTGNKFGPDDLALHVALASLREKEEAEWFKRHNSEVSMDHLASSIITEVCSLCKCSGANIRTSIIFIIIIPFPTRYNFRVQFRRCTEKREIALHGEH